MYKCLWWLHHVAFFIMPAVHNPKLFSLHLTTLKKCNKKNAGTVTLLIVFDLFSADQVIDSSVTAAALMHFM